ncbi:hypothetical protein CBF30_04950 [Vagococcus entomophilus]|uniref:Class A sortase n=2 Tax=Vagococcus entomophilus TaxID=1160095 RepID=A0A430AKE5_9ENTE|nr:hypothetical protein CBF30_04950 [Vagococcus entomophilus]
MMKKNKRNNPKEIGFKLGIISLVYIAMLLVIAPFFKNQFIAYKIQSTNYVLNTGSTSSKNNDLVEEIQPPTLHDAWLLAQRKQPIEANGKISIPELNIDLPIFSELSNSNLYLGAVAMYPDRNYQAENIVLLGHHLRSSQLLFGPLLHSKQGQRIYLSLHNHFLAYEIVQTTIVDQTNTSVLENKGRSDLTLITCDVPTYTEKRFVVQAKLLKNLQEKELEKVIELRKVKPKPKKIMWVLYAPILLLLCLFVLTGFSLWKLL